MPENIEERNIVYDQSIGFTFNARRVVTVKTPDPDTKRIAKETTIEISLGGHAETLTTALDYLDIAMNKCREQVSQESET